jgi:acetyl esterase
MDERPVSEHLLCTPGMKLATDYAALRMQRMQQVDSDMRAIYDHAAIAPTIEMLGVEGIRGLVRAPESAVLAPGVDAWTIEIMGPAGPIPTRIYRPREMQGALGAYVSVHSGGWIFNEGLNHCDTVESRLALDLGCVVVHPDFRVAPEHKFPAAIEDCQAVFQHVVAHAETLDVDRARIGIGGGCTGANIAAVVSMLARDAGQQMPAVQFLWSGALDTRNNYQSHVEFADGYGLRLSDADFVTRCYLRTREDSWDWRASPVLATSMKGLPPTVIWVGEWEILVGENRHFANRLRDAGVELHYIEGAQQGHGHLYARHPQTGAPTTYSRETVPKINEIMCGYIGPIEGDGRA